jgi:hypothetical protein
MQEEGRCDRKKKLLASERCSTQLMLILSAFIGPTKMLSQDYQLA